MIRVYIVTYLRREILNTNLRSLFAGAERHDDVEVTVLSNHPDVELDADVRRANVRVIVNNTRPPNARGYLARDWNFCLLDGFHDWTNPAETSWCVLAQNDVRWKNGWDRVLRAERRFDLVTQPSGDQVVAFQIDALRTLGFFDERFSVLYFQEYDYFARAVLGLGRRASINDDHGATRLRLVRTRRSSHNPVGEVLIHGTSSHEIQSDDAAHLHELLFWGGLHNLLLAKWSASELAQLHDRRGGMELLRRARGGSALPREVNWYPHFWIGCPAEQLPPLLTEYAADTASFKSDSPSAN